MEYARIPRAYWKDRLQKARAMGLNTIATYVYWNLHEPQPGVYNFEGDKDGAAFVREAQQQGLFVILRPGPYICTEWDFGGFPAWLLKGHSMVVRSRDADFLAATARWLDRLGSELGPLQVEEGGPILMVQVENEYGSFGKDHEYMQQMHDQLKHAGFTRAVLYTADGPEETPDVCLPDLPSGINFGPGKAQKGFELLRSYGRRGPFFASEYWAGWFDFWGEKYTVTKAQDQAADIEWMLRQGYSINIYMFHGGTTFGWMNGANSKGEDYRPFITSYDYDSALDESGRPTPKYDLFRETIQRVTQTIPPAIPVTPAPIRIAPFRLGQSASLWQHLPQPVRSNVPLSMEDVGQAYGYILYRTHISGPTSASLAFDVLHDYAQVYVDGKLAGSLDRRLRQTHLALHVTAEKAQLDVLVENTGRVNFGLALRGERKGILGGVTFDGRPVLDWQIYPLPMENPGELTYTDSDAEGPSFYRGAFSIAEPADTFLDTSAFGKGMVWLNGRALGRVWDIGPQKTLYIPGPWLLKGLNDVIVFDLKDSRERTLQGLDRPVLNAPVAT